MMKNTKLPNCKVFTDSNWIESTDQATKEIRLMQTEDIGFDFYKDKADKARYISEETFIRLKRTEILPNDLLVSRLPDPIGKSCIVPNINTKMITGVDGTIIKTKDNLLSESLLYYQMSDTYLKDIISRVAGTTRNRISRRNLGLIKIPIHPLPEQKQIVRQLDQLQTETKKLEVIYEKKIEDLEELKKAYYRKRLMENYSYGKEY